MGYHVSLNSIVRLRKEQDLFPVHLLCATSYIMRTILAIFRNNDQLLNIRSRDVNLSLLKRLVCLEAYLFIWLVTMYLVLNREYEPLVSSLCVAGKKTKKIVHSQYVIYHRIWFIKSFYQ